MEERKEESSSQFEQENNTFRFSSVFFNCYEQSTLIVQLVCQS